MSVIIWFVPRWQSSQCIVGYLTNYKQPSIEQALAVQREETYGT